MKGMWPAQARAADCHQRDNRDREKRAARTVVEGDLRHDRLLRLGLRLDERNQAGREVVVRVIVRRGVGQVGHPMRGVSVLPPVVEAAAGLEGRSAAGIPVFISIIPSTCSGFDFA